MTRTFWYALPLKMKLNIIVLLEGTLPYRKNNTHINFIRVILLAEIRNLKLSSVACVTVIHTTWNVLSTTTEQIFS